MSDPKSKPQSAASATFLRIFRAALVVGIISYLGFFVYSNAVNPDAKHPFKFGLDLAGGSHLVYEADTSKVNQVEIPQLMDVLRTVIEKRINQLGTEENAVYVESSSFVADTKTYRLIIELPGVTDVSEAVKKIGETPQLEFKLVDTEKMQKQNELLQATNTDPKILAAAIAAIGDPYVDTGLTGRYLESAQLQFTQGNSGQVANEPVVAITFSKEGGDLFAQITRDHVGEQLAIFLDGKPISQPRINESITGGTAVISGNFKADEARELAQNLSFGALPMPISLASTQTIDATLGAGVIKMSVVAGAFGFLLISIFLVFWYRIPGLLAVLALASYVIMTLFIFMVMPVTLTAAGLAGMVLSIGIAVDANVLVFERLKEELRAGKESRTAIEDGFARAWLAIRDSNITGLLSAVVLFWFGTSMVKGFALVLAVGIIISMISAISITRTLLLVLPSVKREDSGVWPYLLGTGLTKK